MSEETKAVAIYAEGGAIQPKSFGQIKAEEKFLKEYVDQFLVEGPFKEGADFGSVPGIDHMAFFRGIKKIMRDFNLAEGDPIPHRETKIVIIQDREVEHLIYTVKTPIINIATGRTIGVAMGSCSTLETKYRFRGDNRICPECDEPTIIEGKEQYGGGWVCWKKQGGCGVKFTKEDTRIISQPVGKQENLNPYDLSDTTMFMAQKRGIVRFILYATGLEKYVKVPPEFQDKGAKFGNGTATRESKKNPTQPPMKEAEAPPTQKKGKNGKKPWREMSLKEKQDNLGGQMLDYFSSAEAVERFLRGINSSLGDVYSIKSESQANFVLSQFIEHKENTGG
jgi:hypothetical protein